jgi:hypothetical protein
MKAQFLHRYYRGHSRPIRHHLLAQSENVFRITRRLPRLTNLGKAAMSLLGGDRLTVLIDLPDFKPSTTSRPVVGNTGHLSRMTAEQKQRTVIVLEDT